MPGYQAAKNMLLKVDFAQGAGFQTVSGIQTRKISFPDTSIDVTNQDSEGNYTERVQGFGKDGMEFSGEGVFVSNAVMVQIVQARRSTQILNWQVIVPGLGTFEGPFVIGALELSGDQSAELKFSTSFMSAGPIGYTPNVAV